MAVTAEMGWSHGFNNQGREVGYSVHAECDQDGCDVHIDRGIAYCCGGMHDGGDHGCGGYFCGDHLFHAAPAAQVCTECAKRFCPQCSSDDPTIRHEVRYFMADNLSTLEPCEDEWHELAGVSDG